MNALAAGFCVSQGEDLGPGVPTQFYNQSDVKNYFRYYKYEFEI